MWLWGETRWHEPEPLSPKWAAVASTDGMGGYWWLGRFLLWLSLAVPGVLGIPGALGQGLDVVPQLGVALLGLVGVRNSVRWWRHARVRVEERQRG